MACPFCLLDRRDFLKWSAIGGMALLVPGCKFYPEEEGWVVPKELRKVSRETLNLYRKEFERTRGTSMGFSPHCVNCKGNCAWMTFEYDGKIVREEQLAAYPQIAPNIPDANPRGCNKGAIHAKSLYEKDRLLYPMKRVGARGGGQWKRISWDEALEEIAEKIVEVAGKGEFDRIMVYAGTGILSPARRAAALRLGSLLGAVRFNVASAVGDMFPGATAAYGISTVGCSSEAWFEADYLLIWGINPSVTRIPDAHYIWEGKHRGSRVVTLSPDYNPTARQSSRWIPIKPGTDSYLAMSFIHAILKEGLYDKEFIREQTDLPFLVKVRDERLLRESDLIKGGEDNVFYFFDERSGKPVKAPGTTGSKEPTLELGDLRPALEGVFKVKTPYGEEIEVTTVFERLKKEAERYPPEETQRFTGIHPSIVYEEARRFAKAKVAIIMQGYRVHKYFWGVLTMWGTGLMLALTGHGGRRGGLDIDNEWGLGDLGPLSSPKPARFGSGFLGEWMDGELWKTFLIHYSDEEFKRKTGITKKELLKYIEDAVKKEGFDYFDRPKVMILFHDNKFVRNKSQKQTEKNVLSTCDLYVNVNYRMDSSAALADILLPSTTNYEGWDLRLDPGYGRFGNLMMPPPGLKLPGEVKSEWEICMLLCKKIEETAKKKGIGKIEDPKFKVTRDLDALYGDFIHVGDQFITDEKGVFEWVVGRMPLASGWDLKKVMKTGFVIPSRAAGQTSPLYPDRPYYSFEFQTYLKHPYFTASGRQQFYVDHPLYLKMGCGTPTGRGPVRPEKYPFAYYTPHTRYGIHSTWRTSKWHLRLQRGIPTLYISPKTAAAKGIKDGDRVRVFNDIGEMYVMAKLHPGTRPDAVWMEHAWENFQFKDWKGYNNLVAGLITPLELAGNYGHMSFNPFWDGNQLSSETSVDIQKA